MEKLFSFLKKLVLLRSLVFLYSCIQDEMISIHSNGNKKQIGIKMTRKLVLRPEGDKKNSPSQGTTIAIS
ncbi:hypothetical protein [Flavobacterium frigoris]|uniref:Uncharacterized protein n=1 Tax=Flavobacterium frigoris (strain PS1) TaxID=1086011 RepID=H7FLL5_FLAFP|nr:hypothetical protein [Flavobacterium frigoris]EIA10557.1 hypothetical protein HJ01_00063 [Flavobacterium frigoris PS1]